MKTISLTLPLTSDIIRSLDIDDKVLLNGTILTARDAAHKRIFEMLERGEELPFDLAETTLFYCGPSPTPPDKVCGAIGPTTSSRMDFWTPKLIEHGLRVMIGKGERAKYVEDVIQQHGALYLVCFGGISAYLARSIVSCETFLWPELGAEAVYKLVVRDLPAYVALR